MLAVILVSPFVCHQDCYCFRRCPGIWNFSILWSRLSQYPVVGKRLVPALWAGGVREGEMKAAPKLKLQKLPLFLPSVLIVFLESIANASLVFKEIRLLQSTEMVVLVNFVLFYYCFLGRGFAELFTLLFLRSPWCPLLRDVVIGAINSLILLPNFHLLGTVSCNFNFSSTKLKNLYGYMTFIKSFVLGI